MPSTKPKGRPAVTAPGSAQSRGDDNSATGTKSRATPQDLAAELIRATGPRERKPSWPSFAGSRPARHDEVEDAIRHSQDDTPIAAALRAALSKRGR